MSGAPAETIAVFGGSFDPPHVGHTLAAAYVLAAHPVTQLLAVPTAQHPFDKNLSAFEHRLRMAELAMAPLKLAAVTDLEQRLGGESLTLRTLRALQAERPTAQLRLVLGTDLLRDTPQWHNFAAIERLAPPIIVQRAGFVTDPSMPCLPMVSSTLVRQRAREGLDLQGLVSPKVAEYIEAHGLYRTRNA